MRKGKLTGAKALIKALEAQGVEVIFGYPGGASLPIYDELSRSPIRHVLVRHEQGAAHMADGYSRSTGKTGVCLATSGPGATNLVTGLANAFMDSSPLVAITGQVARSMIGNDAFQEVDITGITIPITKHNYLVQEPHELPHVVEEAFYLAGSGRPGPVLIDVPRDVQQEEFAPHQAKFPQLEGYKPTVEGHPGQIRRAAALLKGAERPLVVAGGGVYRCGGVQALRLLAEKADIPVVYTLMGKASFPNSHPLCLGLLGYHGRVAANTAVMEADVILAIGTRFGDRSTGPLDTFARQARIIHVDIDPAEISKNVPVFLPIVGDAKGVLEQLAGLLPPAQRGAWRARLAEVAAAHPLKGKLKGVSIPNVLRLLQGLVNDPLLVTDVGRHQIFAAHYFPIDSERSFVSSGGLGTMGFGLPAAIGAKVGNPGRTVVAVCGDGSFLMTCHELAAAVAENIPVVALVMNDYCLGMVKQLQDSFYGKRHEACRFGSNVDFARLAESMGAFGARVEKEEQIEPALRSALSSGRPAVIDFVLEEPANVYPMVTGASLLEYVE
jgi:acetolactate synthase-1/2/3 large subunit